VVQKVVPGPFPGYLLVFCPSFFLSKPKAICYPKAIVRKLYLMIGVITCTLLFPFDTWAESYKLTNGETVNGEVLPTSANDQGVQVKIGEGQYQRVPWASFSQEDLRNFSKNERMQPFVEPFIEITQAERVKKTEVTLKQPPKLERPARQSLFGAFFSSGLGVFVMLALYAATVYAAYEVAIFRAQPPLLVCGLSAIPVLGLAAPVVFLALPTNVSRTAEKPAAEPAQAMPGAAAATAEDVNPMLAAGAEHPTGLKLAKETSHAQGKAALPEPIIYQRGQYTFNRRFFETKFSGFFGVVRRDADRDMVLLIKTTRGEFVGQRISRIAANDLHLEVHRGSASEEVLIPFTEIKEICHKHKDA
jgi:hypothetical protein